MTVSSTTTRNSYSGNASTTVFAYGFKIFAEADLKVIIRSSTGVETVKTLNTHYTISNVGNASGGNVTFTSGNTPASGETVVIRREAALTQTTDYTANDPFPAEDHENALDKLTFHTQQQQEELDRAIKLSRTNTMTSTEFTVGATDRANKVLAFDASGEISVTQELGTFKGNSALTTTAAFVVRDIVKCTTSSQLNNVFICVANSAIGDTLTDTDHFALLVDAVSAASSATAAASSASTASTQATNASNSASTASTQASNASTSASTASTQATNAANSATAAASSASSAASTLTTFQGQYHGAASSNPSSNLDAGDLYFNTSDGELKVYTGSAWVSTKPTSTEQTNINTLAASAVVTDMSLLATSDVIADMALLADSDVIADMNALAVTDIINDINTLATSDIVSDLNTLATSDFVSDLNLLASSSNVTAINNVSGSITNVNTVASNLSGVNSFAERYRVQSGVPGSDNDVGDLVFDTAANTLKVFGSSGFQNAGSSVNGTSARFHYDITSTVQSVTGSDANGNTLAYDAGFIDVYVNGVRMSTADVVVTSGDTVTFASDLVAGDEVDIVCFGTFVLANIVSTGALNSGSITSGFGNIDTGSSTITTTGAVSVGAFTSNGIDDNADAVALTIDNGENVAIGVTSKNSSNNGSLTIGHTGMTKISASASGNADELVLIGADASANVGMSIIANNANDSNIFFGDEDDTDIGAIRYAHADNSMRFTVSASEQARMTNDGLDFRNSTGTKYVLFKDGDGVHFGASLGSGASSSVLDDYEEGTWTPTVTDGSSTGTLTSPSGFYTKIGNTVVADYSYTINDTSGLSSGGTLQIGGLPFTSINSFIGSQGSVRSQGFGTADNIPVVAEVLQNSNNIRYHFFSRNNSQRVLTVADISSGEFAAGQIIYKV